MQRLYPTTAVDALLPPQLNPLREIAYNLWWAWNHEAADLFRRLSPALWEQSGHNPVSLLNEVSLDRLDSVIRDEGFMAELLRMRRALARYMARTDTWFDRQIATVPSDLRIAYFSAEYGITKCLPIYSGGLGILAGEHLKSASDLGLPMVGIGLLYQDGRFLQQISANGWQQESYPINDFPNMPLQLKRSASGDPITIEIAYPRRVVSAQIWRAQVGRIPLYLLDTNLSINHPEDRVITGKLYGGGLDMRIRQEVMLGIGGMRALRALDIHPTICHMNEGHAAFLSIERLRMAMQNAHLSFEQAREVTSAGNVFTTHTSVPAGIDLFPPHFIDQYLSDYYSALGMGRDAFLRLGQPPSARPNDRFSMAVLALHLSKTANGVSIRHGQVAREMWRDLWPGTPVDQVPITSVTNGIHPQSWVSPGMVDLLSRYSGGHWSERPTDEGLWERVDEIPDQALWAAHEQSRARLVGITNESAKQRPHAPGATPSEVTRPLDPHALTIAFARRFATYKRATLLFNDPERLARLLNQPGRPVQIIFAGKAHPRDAAGKEVLRQVIEFARRDDLAGRVVFVENYDIALARSLVQGADIWLNTPTRGLEASGTSGMKAAANGVLHLSTLDGWWCEGYAPEVGWCIDCGLSPEGAESTDAREAQATYDLLEREVIPLFYERDSDGLPHGWIAKMKRSMREIMPFFNTHRMVREYAESLYFPAAIRYEGVKTKVF